MPDEKKRPLEVSDSEIKYIRRVLRAPREDSLDEQNLSAFYRSVMEDAEAGVPEDEIISSAIRTTTSGERLKWLVPELSGSIPEQDIAARLKSHTWLKPDSLRLLARIGSKAGAGAVRDPNRLLSTATFYDRFREAVPQEYGRMVGRGESHRPNFLEEHMAKSLSRPEAFPSAYRFALGKLQRPVSATMNTLGAVVEAVKGEGGRAANRLEQAARSVIPGLEDKEDTLYFGTDLLKSAGVGEGGKWEVPIIGNVTPRGLGGFALDAVADPLRGVKIGQLTKSGRAARVVEAMRKAGMAKVASAATKAEGLALLAKADALAQEAGTGGVLGKARLDNVEHIPAQGMTPATNTMRVTGAHEAQALAGQRALLQFGDKTLVHGGGIIGWSEQIGHKLGGNKVTSAIAGAPRYVKEIRDNARAAGGAHLAGTVEAIAPDNPYGQFQGGIAALDKRIAEEAALHGITPDEAYAKILSQVRGRPGPAIRARKAALREDLANAVADAAQKRTFEEGRTPKTEAVLGKRADELVRVTLKGERDAASDVARLLQLGEEAETKGAGAVRKVLDRAAEAMLRRSAARHVRAFRLSDSVATGAAKAGDSVLDRVWNHAEAIGGKAGERLKQLAVELDKKVTGVGEAQARKILDDAIRGVGDDLKDITDLPLKGEAAAANAGDALARRLLAQARKVMDRDAMRSKRTIGVADMLSGEKTRLKDARFAPVLEVERAAKQAGFDLQNVPERDILPHTTTTDPVTGKTVRDVYSGHRAIVDGYLKDGFSPREAVRAARWVITRGADRDFAPYAAAFAERLMKRDAITEIQAGGKLQHLLDVGKYYIAQQLTPEAREFLRRKGGDGVFRKFVNDFYTANHRNAKRRAEIFEGLTIPEINGFVRANWPEFMQAFPNAKWFEEHLPAIAIQRAKNTAKVATTSEFWRQIVDSFSRPDHPALALDGWVDLPPLLEKSGLKAERLLAAANGRRVHPDVVRHIREVAPVLQDAKTPGLLARTYDEVLRLMRTGATVLWPAHFVLNMKGDIFNNALRGVWNPKSYAKALDLMRRYKGDHGASWSLQTPSGAITGTELIRQMQAHHGLFHETRALLEPGKKAPKMSRGKVLDALGVVGGVATAPLRWWAKGGRFANTALSDWTRLSHVIDKLEKGLPMGEAVRSMKEALFDYGDLTRFEKGVMKRTVFFYTWLRKNTPYQIRSMFAYPGRFAALAHFQRLAQDGGRDEGSPLDWNLTPEWMQRRFLGLSPNDDGTVRTMTSLGIPAEDMFSLMNASTGEWLSTLNPIAKATLEWATDTDLFRGRPADRASIAPSTFRHFPQVFQDWLGFREVKEPNGEVRFYTADPRKLRWVLALTPGSRGVQIMDKFADTRPDAIDPVRYMLTGERVANVNPAVLHAKAILTARLKENEEEVLRGTMGRSSNFFVVPRDRMLGFSQDELESKARIREIAEIKKFLKMLEADSEGEGDRQMRSGGR